VAWLLTAVVVADHEDANSRVERFMHSPAARATSFHLTLRLNILFEVELLE
jgi:hypothetical protein